MSRPKGQSKPPGGPRGRGLKDIRIDEEVKIAVNLAFERFQYSDQKGTWKVELSLFFIITLCHLPYCVTLPFLTAEMEFPSSFSSTERAFVHRLAQSLGYISKSRGYVLQIDKSESEIKVIEGRMFWKDMVHSSHVGYDYNYKMSAREQPSKVVITMGKVRIFYNAQVAELSATQFWMVCQ